MFDEKPLDTVGSFWVVVMPSRTSTVGDICFESTATDMMLQALGGLKIDSILGIYKSHDKAKRVAEQLVQAVQESLKTR